MKRKALIRNILDAVMNLQSKALEKPAIRLSIEAQVGALLALAETVAGGYPSDHPLKLTVKEMKEELL